MNQVADITANHAWTGSRYIDVLNPRPEDMDPFEIATGLSREARYGAAATSIFWSVAQHSLLCDHLAQAKGIADRRLLRTILMHDAPEYMLRDMIRPVKRNVPSYHVLEHVWWKAIAVRFDLLTEMPGRVKHLDDLACAVEKNDLISPGCGAWPGILVDPGHIIPRNLLGLTMDGARDLFLRRLAALAEPEE